MSPEKRIQLAIGLVLFFLVVGTLGYSAIDHYTLLDAFYMTVITISTVGYGEIQQLSEAGRLFTIFLILFSVGSLALLAGAFSELLIERAANPTRWKKTMEKRINKLRDHVIICGHGRVGFAAADHFFNHRSPFVVIENQEEEIKNIQELSYCFIKGDGTREDILLKANIKQASALLAVMDSDPENLFAVLTARELNPTLRIIARTENQSSESRLLRAGADSVISPFVAAGQKVAQSLMTNSSLDDIQSIRPIVQQATPEWIEVSQKTTLAGNTMRRAEQILGCRILGIRRAGQDSLLPTAEDILKDQDSLLILSKGNISSQLFTESVDKKIVLIDDNPVITRLYTRLFQKAGYETFSSATGEQGLELILKEKPDAAVIDFHLPDMSGAEICKEIRRNVPDSDIRLFLFTGDTQASTKESALAAGADAVVVKSPEAEEIINLVSQHLY